MSRAPFPSLRVAGGLLPADLFTRIIDDTALPGRDPADYGLGARRTVREAASRAFEDLAKEWQALSRDQSRTRDWLRALYGGDGLGFGPLEALPGGLVVDGKTFKVSHRWQHVPVHWLPWGTDLDHRSRGVVGAADAAPQSMVQELLNRTDEHLFAMISNGQKVRLLRDSRALAGSAYVELDLELIFSEGLFPDFLLLFRLLHASRFEIRTGDSPASCWLETWRTTAIQQGERALERLRGGVEQAINTLGTGFVRHPANGELNRRLASGTLRAEDYKRSVLRLVYRLLFWFVAEDRDVLLDPDAAPATRKRYDRYFSGRRLRDRARRGGADHHDDLWEAVRLVFTGLGSEQGQPALGIPGIGGIFERITRDLDGSPIEPSRPDELDEPLEGMRLTNEALLSAVRSLAIVDGAGQRRQVDFLNLDSEELGSVYESLLELHPSYDPAGQVFKLTEAAGNERKTTGSYYTPSSLTEALLDSALDPVLDDAVRDVSDVDASVEALLNVTVCDPACGSGHFLVAAARRIARRVAQLRSGENEPSPTLVRTAMREVVSRCVYGVDINETAAELAKVSLWLESVEPGKPLPFLDANIRVGNSLLGTTPALIEKGIPQEAFKPLVGDDPKAARAIAKRNAEQGEGIFDLFASDGPITDNTEIANHTRDLVRSTPRTLTDVYVQRRRLRDIDGERLAAKRVADAWCAAFVQPKTQDTALHAVIGSTLDWIAKEPDTLERAHTTDMVDSLTRDYRFFHWHVEFPHIFAVPNDGSPVDRSTGWRGGISCVLGNPPWEHIELKEQEFFAFRRPDIAEAANASKRKRAIDALETSVDELDQKLHADFGAAKHFIDGTRHFLASSGRFPLTGRGRVKTDSVFAETGRTILAPRARVGMVLPTGIATDATTQYFFKDLVQTHTLASIYDFENEEKVFPGVHNQFRFCLWSASGQKAPIDRISMAFRLRQTTQIQDRRFVLTPEDITLLNPNTGTCPVFDHKRNAEITLAMYRHIWSVLWRESPEENPWRVSFMQGTFNMASDSHLFHDREPLERDGWTLIGNAFERDGVRMLPLYEAKMIHHFDHRFSTYEGATEAQLNKGTLPRTSSDQKGDPNYAVLPRYWVAESEVQARLDRKSWDKDWLLGWRNIARTSDARTMVCGHLPKVPVGHSYPLFLSRSRPTIALYLNLASFALDYAGRQKMAGTNYTFNYVKQLPVITPDTYLGVCNWSNVDTFSDWLTRRGLELVFTTYDMAGFARDHGDEGAPFRWDEERRFWLRAELDAAYFHLYGVPHDDVDYIMDTFRAFRNNDPDRFARTKQTILDIYDDMAKAIATGEPYRTRLDPPPGHGPRHPARPDSGVTSHG